MKRLSIIVPIYNVEPYLERCLRSLEDQDIPREDYEIICINDGSPDDSRSVVIRMQTENENITLIEQDNGGVSRARNKGIENANGKYILFIDPDDYVDSKCFNRILANADNHDAQVAFLGFTVLDENGTIRNQVFNANYSFRVFTGIETYYLARGNGRTDPDRLWAVLIKSEFLNYHKLQYLGDVPYLEDGELIARILCLATCCTFDGHSFYQRTTRPGSATNSNLFNSPKATNGFLSAAMNLKRFQNEEYLNEEQRYFLNQPICKFVLLAVRSALRKPYYKNYSKIRDELIINNLSKVDIKGVVKPYIYYAFLYNNMTIAFLIIAHFKETKLILKQTLNSIKALNIKG